MRGKSILYFGVNSGTSLDRANALRRLDHTLHHIDLRALLPVSKWVERVQRRLGGGWFEARIMRALPGLLQGRQFDLCFVDSGELVTPAMIALLRKHAPKIVNYNIDDPLGTRDGATFKAYRQSLPYYDLCVVMRTQNIAEATALGAKAVMRVHRSADEVSHAPRMLTAQDHAQWDSEVLFLGTWFPERGPFLLELIRHGVPLTIRGARWNKAREWRELGPHCAGGHLEGDAYAKAIQCARVNLGLLSKGNRDLHTTRSLEIPALGALLCAERTTEHVAMYEDGKEALFWNNAAECAAACRQALANAELRAGIAAAGHRRIRANGHYNEPIMNSIVARAFEH